MTRFVHIKDANNEVYLNTRFITGIYVVNEESIRVELYDRSAYKLDRSYLPELLGDNVAASAVPCDGLVALFGRDGEALMARHIAGMAVTASGKVRPLGYDSRFVDHHVETLDVDYISMCPDMGELDED